MKTKYIYIIALVCGLLTSYLAYSYINRVEEAATMDYEEVIMVVGDIAPKTLIREEMLVKKAIPKEGIHPQAARKLEEAAGFITTSPLYKDEQVLKSKLAKLGDTGNGLAYTVPVGKRAITVAVDEVSGIAGFVKPGDHVDIVGTINIKENEKDVPYAFLLLQDLQVLASGKVLEDKGDAKGPQEYTTITLAVTPAESLSLVMTSQKGTIRLMLRSPIDGEIVQIKPIKPENLIR